MIIYNYFKSTFYDVFYIKIIEKDEYEVESVLDEWVEYLKRQQIEGETCYGIYHKSFLDFLKSKRVLNSTRRLFQEVNQRIADYLYEEEDEEGDNIR